MKKIIINQDKNYKSNLSFEERLNIVERLRIESGKFLYEYPARFRRIIKIIRKK